MVRVDVGCLVKEDVRVHGDVRVGLSLRRSDRHRLAVVVDDVLRVERRDSKERGQLVPRKPA